jgi:hypothetical protein
LSENGIDVPAGIMISVVPGADMTRLQLALPARPMLTAEELERMSDVMKSKLDLSSDIKTRADDAEKTRADDPIKTRADDPIKTRADAPEDDEAGKTGRTRADAPEDDEASK